MRAPAEKDTIRPIYSVDQLLSTITRPGARREDVLVDSLKLSRAPYKRRLDATFKRSRDHHKPPIVWVNHLTPDGDNRSLVVMLMRYWGPVKPKNSMIQVLNNYALADHLTGYRSPLGDKWEAAHMKAVANGKRWAAVGAWNKSTDEDGVIVTDASWLLADPEMARAREAVLVEGSNGHG